MRLSFIFVALSVVACGSADPSPVASDPAPESTDPTPEIAAGPRGDADPVAAVPPCPRAPCAARPIVFVHGHRGSNSDWAPAALALVKDDGRFDAVRFVGTDDHASWPTNGIGRRSWLFVFDYYVKRGDDARGSHTAGPGRVGSSGAIVADRPVYDAESTHEYGADLAALVADVQRATGAPKIDIVAHSMGGLIARSFISFHGGNDKVERLVLAASPHAGVGLAGFATLFGDAPKWMAAMEMAELDSGSPFQRARFHLPDEPSTAAGAWTAKLLSVEAATPIAAEVHAISGERDLLVPYASAHHPATKTHVTVDADHAGVLTAPGTYERIRELCGGSLEVQ